MVTQGTVFPTIFIFSLFFFSLLLSDHMLRLFRLILPLFPPSSPRLTSPYPPFSIWPCASSSFSLFQLCHSLYLPILTLPYTQNAVTHKALASNYSRLRIPALHGRSRKLLVAHILCPVSRCHYILRVQVSPTEVEQTALLIMACLMHQWRKVQIHTGFITVHSS
jgi:hypothetical protein